MPSFAIPTFTVLLKPLWVPAEFFLLSTGPNLDGTFFSARSCSRVFGFSILFDLPFLKIGIKRPSTFRIVRPVNGQFFDIRFLCLVRQTLARFVTLSVDSPRPRHRVDPAPSSATFRAPIENTPPSAGSADTRCGRSVCLLPAL